jgi:hypothetical protein
MGLAARQQSGQCRPNLDTCEYLWCSLCRNHCEPSRSSFTRAPGNWIRLPGRGSRSCSGSRQGVLSQAHPRLRLRRPCSPSRTKPDLAEQKISATNQGTRRNLVGPCVGQLPCSEREVRLAALKTRYGFKHPQISLCDLFSASQPSLCIII